MGAISEIIKGVKDITEYKLQANTIKLELKDEIILNIKFLKDVQSNKAISDERLKEVIQHLSIEEMNAYLISKYPKSFICRKKVTEAVVGKIPAQRLLTGNQVVDLEELCRRIRRMIKYLKADFDGLKRPKQNALNIKYYLQVARKLI